MEETTEKTTVEDAEVKPEEKLSLADEARGIRDEILKAKEELKAENDRKDKLQSDDLLSSSAGGHVDAVQVSPEDAKKVAAKEFFKGTALEEAIDKT